MRCLLLVYMMATGQQKTNDVHSQTQLSERSRLHYKFSSYGFYSNLMSLTIGEYFCSYHFFFLPYMPTTSQPGQTLDTRSVVFHGRHQYSRANKGGP